MKRLAIPYVLAGLLCGTVQAHHPDRANQPVRQRVDCIGPVGSNLRPSYRRVYNRPTDLGGKIAYLIAPTSQEAMAWHRAKHKCAYQRNLPRQEPYYFYPKPWESLQIGPRPLAVASEADSSGGASTSVNISGPYGAPEEDGAPEEYSAPEEVETTEIDPDAPPPPASQADPLMLPEDV